MQNNDNKFDLDLWYGKIYENKFLSILLGSLSFEIKAERGAWRDTGNIAIEYESRGKKSGVLVTQAEYWVHFLGDSEGKIHGMYVFPVKNLIKWLKLNKDTNRKVSGGDDNTSKLVLVPIARLHEIINMKE